MQRNHFELVTDWDLDGSMAELDALAHETLGDLSTIERLWPAAFLRAELRAPGDAQGRGQIVRLRTRGFLPYTLDWQVETVEAEYLRRYVQVATGDLEGTAVWTFTATKKGVRVRLHWRVQANKPLVRWLALLLRPLIVRNHRWAMARGRQSVDRELARRRALRARAA